MEVPMNAFYEHHKDSIEFGYRCFDRLLLNGLIQPFQQPERVLGFFNTYRDGKRVTHRALTEIADQFLYWVKNRAEKWGAPIVEAICETGGQTLVPSAGDQAGGAGGSHRVHQSDRRLHRRGLQSQGSAARRQGGQADASPARLSGPDRPASALRRNRRHFSPTPLPMPTRRRWTACSTDEQHGVRWSRYWLDVLRYADLDGLDGSVMPAAPGIYLWRDWVIKALNHDMPYDQFVRAQILGNRYRPETATASSGRRTRVEGSVEDSFALGFLARSAVTRNDQGSRHPLRRGGDDFDRVHGHDGGLREVPRP